MGAGAAMGGAVLGGLLTAHRSSPSTRLLASFGVFFGATIVAVSLAPGKLLAIVFLVPMGAASISFIALAIRQRDARAAVIAAEATGPDEIVVVADQTSDVVPLPLPDPCVRVTSARRRTS